MKKTAILLALITVTILQGFTQTDNYYFYKGEKVEIIINEEMYYVSMTDTTGLTNFFSSSDFVVIDKKSGVNNYKSTLLPHDCIVWFIVNDSKIKERDTIAHQYCVNCL